MGPLKGIRVIEMAGVGPTPYCATLLADAGADVIRIERSQPKALVGRRDPADDPLLRSRRCISLDLKKPEGIATLKKLLTTADALLEGFRPGTMERLGLGPQECLAINPRLVYGRLTGWGQTGPLAMAAGHDINYIALSGALHATGTKEQPTPPLNLVGDFAAGSLLLAFGMTNALVHAGRTGQGQVVDAAMSDGAALLMAPFYAMVSNGSWTDERANNTVDGGAPDYGCYTCKDGKFISIAPLEPQFYEQFLRLMAIDDPAFQNRYDRSQWPHLKEVLATRFLERTRDEWCTLLEGTDVCFAPVLSIAEAHQHAHHVARQRFVQVGQYLQPAPAPLYSLTPSTTPQPRTAGRDVARSLLQDAGLSEADIAALDQSGAWLDS